VRKKKREHVNADKKSKREDRKQPLQELDARRRSVVLKPAASFPRSIRFLSVV
jgi:hypothetical protein